MQNNITDRQLRLLGRRVARELSPEVREIYNDRMARIRADRAKKRSEEGLEEEEAILEDVQPKSHSLTLVVTGDSETGKSSLIRNFTDNSYNDSYIPTTLDTYRGMIHMQYEGEVINLDITIHDCSGNDIQSIDRRIPFRQADCFIVCAAVNQPSSFDSLNRWKSEIDSIQPQIPIALFLTKNDLANFVEDHNKESVNLKMIQKKQQSLNMTCFASTSAKEWQDMNVQNAFRMILIASYEFKYVFHDI